MIDSVRGKRSVILKGLPHPSVGPDLPMNTLLGFFIQEWRSTPRRHTRLVPSSHAMLRGFVALMLLDTDRESDWESDGDAAPNHLDTLSSNGCHLFEYASSVSRELVMDDKRLSNSS